MIHKTRKQANVPDTSVYGIATDSFEWVFIRIRPNGEVRDLGEIFAIILLIHFLVCQEVLRMGAQFARDCFDAGKNFRSSCGIRSPDRPQRVELWV